MAKSHIIVTNGAVSFPTGFNMDAQTMRIHEMQNSENITSYQGTVYGIFLGTGTPIQDVQLTGYPFKGTSSSPLGFGMGTNSTYGGSVLLSALGSAAMFTIDTGCTYAGSYIVDDISMDHSRLVAGAKTSMSMKPSSDLTLAWATS